MKSSGRYISTLIIVALMAIANQACDSTLNVEEPQTFYKYIGNDDNQEGVDMVTDEDGNVYILGATYIGDGAKQIYIAKTDPGGILQWEHTYGDPGETPKDIELMRNGNLAVLGDINISGERDIVIYLIDSSDGRLVMRNISGNPGEVDNPNSITQIDDGFIVASSRDSLTYKIGDVRRYLNDLTPYAGDWLEDIEQDRSHTVIPVKSFKLNDGDEDPNNDTYYTFGYSNTTAGGDDISDYDFFIWVANNSHQNKLPWLSILGPDARSNEQMITVKEIPGGAGGYVAVGYTTDANGSQQPFIAGFIRDFTAAGFTNDNRAVWGQPAAKVLPYNLAANSDLKVNVYPTASSGYLILADDRSLGNGNIYLTRVNNTFEQVWTEMPSHTFGGIGEDSAGAVGESLDGNILVCGTMTLGEINGQKKIVFMKLNPEGILGD